MKVTDIAFTVYPVTSGIYFGGARPILNHAFERKAGFVHMFALLVAWCIS